MDDTQKYFMKIKSFISQEARAKLLDKVPDCFDDENPKVLIDAIKLTFLGTSSGVVGNRISVSHARNIFNQLKQAFGQSTHKFIETHRAELQVLLKQELDAGATQENLDIIWSEERVIDHFIDRLCPVRFAEWRDNMKYDKVTYPTPETLDATYKEAIIREEQFRSKQKWMLDRANAYYAVGGSGKRDKPRGAAPAAADDKLRDAKGKLVCYRYNSKDGSECEFGDKCRFSHSSPAVPKGKSKADVEELLAKAVKQVAFADEDSRAGGGPGHAQKKNN